MGVALRRQSAPPPQDAEGLPALVRLLSLSLQPERAESLARALIARFGSVGASLGAPESEIARLLGGDGPAARVLKDCHRLVIEALRPRPKQLLIGATTELLAYLSVSMADEAVEQVKVLHLDRKLHLLADETMWAGTHDHAVFYPRELIRRALELRSSKILVVHNHPSGIPDPSPCDLRTTDEIVAGCAVFGIEVIDHIVIGRGNHFSFRAQGLLPPGAAHFDASSWAGKRRRLASRQLARSLAVATDNHGGEDETI